jgi:DNA-binding PadR family transcriptional regulator
MLTSDPTKWNAWVECLPKRTPTIVSPCCRGTMDLLILRTLVLGSYHGQGMARSIQRQSEDVLFVDHCSLYLALQRLEDKKWISAKWA